MHPGRWFNETAFDSLDYLVPALLLFVLAAAKWAWRYWHRESLRARRIVLSLLTIGAGCLLLWVVLGRRPWWLPLVGLALGPRSEEHTSELQSHSDLVCRLLLEKKKTASVGWAARANPHPGGSARRALTSR